MASEKLDIHAIFNEAIARDSHEERAKYLDEACGNDPTVRGRVEALLQAHSEAGGFLGGQSACFAGTETRPITEKPGTTIGPYKLLQQIGEGGMGVVYLAEQKEPVKRRVALKIIKPGMDTQHVIARFEAERQALAMMDHPNIAKVIDAGATETGRPYFVMELVNGIPLTDYCDEQRLTPQERLELFVQVCQAVQHAHQKGVIHRDLKPANILVAEYDQNAVPRIIDFGIAKATSQTLTEKTMFTQLGQIVGTLDYMSPEQAKRNQLDVDTRSDIYSLGVILYELLTGETPFDKQRLRSAAFDEMLRIIREEEPPRPSTRLSTNDTLPSIAANRHVEPSKLSTLIRGELDWIAMKALEKDRGRRYETASAFAADVQHYLNDEAVVACPPSPAYRFRKFARRNKLAIVTTAAIALSLIVGAGAATWQAFRAIQQRDRAVIAEGLAQSRLENEQQQRRRAERAEELARMQADRANGEAARADAEAGRARVQRERAEANFELARQAVDEYFTLVSESTLLNEPGLQPLRRDLLKAAARFHETLATRRSDDLNSRADLALAHLRLVEIYRILGHAEEQVFQLQQGVAVAEQILKEQPEATELHLKFAGFWRVRGDSRGLFRWIMNHPEKLPKHVSIYEKAIDVWSEFARRNPGVGGFEADISIFWDNIGTFHWSMGQREEWLRSKQKAVEVCEKLVRDYPGNVEYRVRLASSFIGLGNAIGGSDPQKTVELIQRAVEMRKELVEEFPGVPDHRYWLAEHYHRLGGDSAPRAVLTNEETGEYLRLALELFTQLAKEFPYEPTYPKRITRSGVALANLLAKTGRTKEAISEFRKVLLLEPNHTRTLNTLARHLLQASDISLRNPTEALDFSRRATKLSPSDWLSWETLSRAAFETGNWEECIVALQRKAGIRGAYSDPRDRFYTAMSHWHLGNQTEARKWYDDGITELHQRKKPSDCEKTLRKEAEELMGIVRKEKPDIRD